MLSPHEYEELLYAAQNKEVPTKDIKVKKCRLNRGKSTPRADSRCSTATTTSTGSLKLSRFRASHSQVP
jgi:hypothetical protein